MKFKDYQQDKNRMYFFSMSIKIPLKLFKTINFRQNMAVWMQPMCTHNLTQAQDPGK